MGKRQGLWALTPGAWVSALPLNKSRPLANHVSLGSSVPLFVNGNNSICLHSLILGVTKPCCNVLSSVPGTERMHKKYVFFFIAFVHLSPFAFNQSSEFSKVFSFPWTLGLCDEYSLTFIASIILISYLQSVLSLSP